MSGIVQRGMERFADRLELPGPLVTLGEGDTPLVHLKNLGAAVGLSHLYAKLEFINPTGSYKDRIAAVSMTHAVARGNQGWIATSSGNAGMALAAYGARAGLPGLLFTVPNIPLGKLLPLQALGAQVYRVSGVGEGGTREAETAMFSAVQSCAERHGLFLGITAHAFNAAGMRGAATIAWELHEADPEIRAVYVPTGGGGLAAAIGQGLQDVDSGIAVVVAQPEGCAPIVRHLEGEIESPVIDRCTSDISALQLPSPPDGAMAVDAVRASNGWGSAASDAAIRDAQRRLAETEGLFVEGAAACALAAAISDRKAGRLNDGDKVVLVLTGSGLKDTGSIAEAFATPDLVAPGDVEDLVATSHFSERA